MTAGGFAGFFVFVTGCFVLLTVFLTGLAALIVLTAGGATRFAATVCSPSTTPGKKTGAGVATGGPLLEDLGLVEGSGGGGGGAVSMLKVRLR